MLFLLNAKSKGKTSGRSAQRQPFEPHTLHLPLFSLYREAIEQPLSSHWTAGAGWQRSSWNGNPGLIPSIEEGVGRGSMGMTTILPSTVTVRSECKQCLQSIANPPPRARAQIFSSASFNLTPFWDVCLPARKCLITFEYKGSSLATKEIILKYCIQRSFPPLILFFLLNPMNVSWDRWY